MQFHRRGNDGLGPVRRQCQSRQIEYSAPRHVQHEHWKGGFAVRWVSVPSVVIEPQRCQQGQELDEIQAAVLFGYRETSRIHFCGIPNPTICAFADALGLKAPDIQVKANNRRLIRTGIYPFFQALA